MIEAARAHGWYDVTHIRQGRAIWSSRVRNTVVTVGKNLALDTYLAGAAYTVTGPYMGLISGTSFSAISAADTMSSHAGWLEAGSANNPTYDAPRKTLSWSAASAGAKPTATPCTFSLTSNGTVKGVFIVFGPSASSTIGSTAGTLYSAGLFSLDRAVINGDVMNISYMASL